MKLTTEISFPSFDNRLDYESKSVFSGSCFSENIGAWLKKLKFDADSNLCGNSYNPISLASHILVALSGKEVHETELIQSRNQFIHPDFHSVFNHKDPTETVSQINGSLKQYREALLSANFLFITFGTAIVFESVVTGKIVNNCHHLPINEFSRRMVDESLCADIMETALTLLRTKNPKIHFYFTVSPIRHLRHGAIANNRSKARLIKLCEILEKKFKNSSYLPVYELVMDELRDYRFYRHDDFIHLNELGIDLIREKVKASLISPAAYALMTRIEKWNTMCKHKIQNRDSIEFKRFNEKLEIETADLEGLLPGRF